MNERDKEPTLYSMSDEDFEEYIVKPIEQKEKCEKSHSEPTERDKAINIIGHLSTTALVQLAVEHRGYEGDHEESLQQKLLREEISKRELKRD